jgi:hypothetical protein
MDHVFLQKNAPAGSEDARKDGGKPRRPQFMSAKAGERPASMMVLLVGVVLLEMIESSGHAGNADEEEKEVHVVS